MSKEKIKLATACYLLAFAIKKKRKEKVKKTRKCWVKSWMDCRKGNMNLVQELVDSDITTLKNFLRMDEPTFEKLLSKINQRIKKKDTHWRQAIPARTKLIVTLRYLASGDSFRSLMYNFRISESTISLFIPAVCHAIYEELAVEYLKVPNTVAEWLKISSEFQTLWNLPNVIGAMDGKHVQIQAQGQDGSAFYNYKGQHSIALLAIVDANYKFIYINVGINGRISDGGVYRESDICKAIERNVLNFPDDTPLPNRTKAVPFVIVADAAFPLSQHVLKPYPFKNMTKEQRIFNYRLSRARRIVENAFGILANRFRVLLHINPLGPAKAKIITQCCCVLHNFLRTELPHYYVHDTAEDELDPTYKFPYGLSAQGGNRVRNEILSIREEFKEYVNKEGAVPWQDNMI